MTAAAARRTRASNAFFTSEALALALILGFAAFVRVRLLAMPLERDEGEFAYVAQLILKGLAPYKAAYTMKLPGTHLLYAVFLGLFGQTASAIHLGLLLVNALTIVAVHLLGRRLHGVTGGLVAAAGFALFSLIPGVLGLAAHATQFLVLFSTFGVLVALHAATVRCRWAALSAGALFGAAVLAKQHALFLALFGAGIVGTSHEAGSKRQRLQLLAWFTLGVAAPLAACVSWLAAADALTPFFRWTFGNATAYISERPLASSVGRLFRRAAEAAGPAAPLWVLATGGLVYRAWTTRAVEARRRWRLEGWYLLASFAAILPGFNFWPHYYILLLPPLALSLGGFVTDVRLPRLRWAPLAAAGVAAMFVLIADRRELFTLDPVSLSRLIYFGDPFAESPAIADYVAAHTNPGARIAVLGSEPQIYFYARRLAATRYLYAYPLLEPQPRASEMQRELIAELESARPEVLVVVDVPSSWVTRAESDRTIFTWSDRFARENYRLVGAVDIHPHAEASYFWDDKARGYKPGSPFRVLVMARKTVSKP